MNHEKIPKPRKFRQNTEAAAHYHPRKLARAIAHRDMANEEIGGVNKVAQGAEQSIFARNWREYAGDFAKRMDR